MKRNWKRSVVGLVVGVCCLATVAEVDAGIIFRRRPGMFQGRNTTYQATMPATGAVAATPAPTPVAPGAGAAAAGGATTGAAVTTTTTNRTRSRRLGRRRGNTGAQVTVAPATTTVRGQTP